MADAISSSTAQPIPNQTPPPAPEARREEQSQSQVEAPQENQAATERRPDPSERVGTNVDTSA